MHDLIVIGIAGVKLSRYSDIIAGKSGMSGLVVVGLALRPASRIFRTVSWISLLPVIYLLNVWFLYLHG